MISKESFSLMSQAMNRPIVHRCLRRFMLSFHWPQGAALSPTLTCYTDWWGERWDPQELLWLCVPSGESHCNDINQQYQVIAAGWHAYHFIHLCNSAAFLVLQFMTRIFGQNSTCVWFWSEAAPRSHDEIKIRFIDTVLCQRLDAFNSLLLLPRHSAPVYPEV